MHIKLNISQTELAFFLSKQVSSTAFLYQMMKTPSSQLFTAKTLETSPAPLLLPSSHPIYQEVTLALCSEYIHRRTTSYHLHSLLLSALPTIMSSLDYCTILLLPLCLQPPYLLHFNFNRAPRMILSKCKQDYVPFLLKVLHSRPVHSE